MTPGMRTLQAVCFLSAAMAVQAQVRINGPMPGYTDLRETRIWLQCHGPCRVALAYWDEARPDSVLRTGELDSDPMNGNALTFTLGDLEPGRTYGYRVELDGAPYDAGELLRFHTQPLWRHRTDPPPFKLVVGSCTYVNEPEYDRPGKPYGGDYQIFGSIAALQPDLMLWLGDNVYFREPDWGSWSGIVHRYTHTRSLPELQHLLRCTQHVAIWDDHDFGPNDANGAFVNAALTTRAFGLFWPNPSMGVNAAPGTVTTMFQYHDIDFFLLDDRSVRVPAEMRTKGPTILGAAQIDWLIQALKYSRAPFKMVAIGGQFLNTAAVYENYAMFAEERQRIIDRIAAEGITGVVFLSGDRHFTELSRLDLPDGNVIHDFTVSPLTSGVHPPNEQNDLRVEGTLVADRNFGVLEFAGPANARTLRLAVYDSEGLLQWDRTIAAPKSGR